MIVANVGGFSMDAPMDFEQKMNAYSILEDRYSGWTRSSIVLSTYNGSISLAFRRTTLSKLVCNPRRSGILVRKIKIGSVFLPFS